MGNVVSEGRKKVAFFEGLLSNVSNILSANDESAQKLIKLSGAAKYPALDNLTNSCLSIFNTAGEFFSSMGRTTAETLDVYASDPGQAPEFKSLCATLAESAKKLSGAPQYHEVPESDGMDANYDESTKNAVKAIATDIIVARKIAILNIGELARSSRGEDFNQVVQTIGASNENVTNAYVRWEDNLKEALKEMDINMSDIQDAAENKVKSAMAASEDSSKKISNTSVSGLNI